MFLTFDSIRCRALAGAACGVLLFPLAACQPTSSRSSARRVLLPVQSDHEHLDRALECLENLDQFQEQRAVERATYHLNRWFESQKPDDGWKPDEMVNRLPKSVRERGVLDELPRKLFSVNDVNELQGAVWMRQLSGWISRQPLPSHFASWIERNAERLGERESEQLALAYRLFDWTVSRNVQLDELMPYPEESAGVPAAQADSKAAALPAAIRGEPGPGYHLEPRQVLVYGRGDAWQRMRVFTHLARQQGIDAVTLSFPGRSNPPRPRPWVSGVLIKEQLFLFDARLGLAIPGRNLEGIATLKEVLDDPSLLTALDIDDQHRYRVDPKDLAEVAALIDVQRGALSRRFELLERQLTGDHHCVLTVPMTRLTNALKGCQGLYDVYTWSVPFEAVWYRLAQEARLREDPQAEARYMMKYGIYLNHSALVRARYLYFRGRFDSDDDQTGAKKMLLDSRVARAELDDLLTNKELQQGFGLVKGPREPEEIWQGRLTRFRNVMIDAKQSASFWMGLLQLESGHTDSAIEWLKVRSLESWPDGTWVPATRYNLARAYEIQGNWTKAQEVLLADNSPQSHGNHVRARILQRHLAQPPAKAQ